MKVHNIFEPRWRDKTVLIAGNKIAIHNLITFTRIPNNSVWAGDWYVSGETIRKYKPENMRTRAGGTIRVYPVPLNVLKPYELLEKDEEDDA